MPETVLAADDDRGILLLIQAILGPENFSLVTAPDGETARTLIAREPERFSAVLLDWEMPAMTGIDLLRWIKNQPVLADLPVILATAMDGDEQVREGIEAGAFYYVTKPFDRRLLLSILNAALADYRYKKSLCRKLKESQNPFQNLMQGQFRFRTLAEGERLALWIANACPRPSEVTEINEIMINAVEHGNLGITYREKTELVEKGQWQPEVEKRLMLPDFAGRFVRVRLRKTEKDLTILVEDQGEGFDFSSYLAFDASRAFDNHGRGIFMAGAVMTLQYLGRGNRVRVTIPFN